MDFQTVKSLGFTFAPFLISYGLSYYRSLKAQTQSTQRLRRPVPPHIRYAIVLLLAAAACFFAIGLPVFAQENIFKISSSRLQTPSTVLWQRIAKSRTDGTLTPFDERLGARLNSTKARLFYLKYGPETVTDCSFCHTDDPMTYLIYALPAIVLPHLANIAILGVSTSNFLSGKEGNRWRTQAALAGSIFAVLDVCLFYNYDPTKNALAMRGEDLTNFYWVMRAVRLLGICVLDIAFSGLLWATSTNRIMIAPVTSTEKVQEIIGQLQVATGKVGAVNILRNTFVREPDLQELQAGFWRDEGNFTREIMSDEEVNRSITTAVNGGRLDLRRVEHDAQGYAKGLMDSVAQGNR